MRGESSEYLPQVSFFCVLVVALRLFLLGCGSAVAVAAVACIVRNGQGFPRGVQQMV